MSDIIFLYLLFTYSFALGGIDTNTSKLNNVFYFFLAPVTVPMLIGKIVSEKIKVDNNE